MEVRDGLVRFISLSGVQGGRPEVERAAEALGLLALDPQKMEVHRPWAVRLIAGGRSR